MFFCRILPDVCKNEVFTPPFNIDYQCIINKMTVLHYTTATHVKQWHFRQNRFVVEKAAAATAPGSTNPNQTAHLYAIGSPLYFHKSEDRLKYYRALKTWHTQNRPEAFLTVMAKAETESLKRYISIFGRIRDRLHRFSVHVFFLKRQTAVLRRKTHPANHHRIYSYLIFVRKV